MKKQEKSGNLSSVKENEPIQYVFGFMGLSLKPIGENFVFVFWAAISFMTIYILMFDDRLVIYLSEANKILQNSLIVFANFNKINIFYGDLANAHFFLMILCVPIQLVMLFVIPDHRIAAGVQKKGKGNLLLGVILFAAPLAVIIIFGPGISTRYTKFIDKNLTIAIVDYAITIGFSYLVRITYILLKNKNWS